MRQARRFPAYAGLTRLTGNGPVWTGEVRFVPEMLDYPLKLRKPHRIFVNSMSDLFHEAIPDSWIDRIFVKMIRASHHTFMVLTKRAMRMRTYMNYPRTLERITKLAKSEGIQSFRWPIRNVWLGVSVEDEKAVVRVVQLGQTRAALRWISAEPLIGPFKLDRLWDYLDFAIIGGESGYGARLMQLDWARNLLREGQEYDVKMFVKQLGAEPYDGRNRLVLSDSKGGDMDEWPIDLRVREYPNVNGS